MNTLVYSFDLSEKQWTVAIILYGFIIISIVYAFWYDKEHTNK